MGLVLDFFRAVGENASAPINATSRLAHLQLRGLGADAGEQASAETTDEAPVLPQLGMLARPVVRSTLRALGVRDGDEVFLLKLWDKAISHATAPVAGETRVYATGQPAVCLRLWDGFIELRVNVTGTVKLAPDAADYAAQPVARKLDTVNAAAALTTFFTQVKTVCDGIAPGVVTLPAPVTIGAISSGAAKVLA